MTKTVLPRLGTLFLDDDPHRITIFRNTDKKAIVVMTAKDAIRQLKKVGIWDRVFLDHDLGGEAFVNSSRKDTGMEVVRWIVSNRPIIDSICVHSWNSSAAPR